MTEASYHMLKVLSFGDREKALPPSNSRADFSDGKKKSKMKLSGASIFWEYAKNKLFKSKVVRVVVLFLESKGL